MTLLMEVINKDIKMTIANMFQMFKTVEKYDYYDRNKRFKKSKGSL